jgi:TonB family protein
MKLEMPVLARRAINALPDLRDQPVEFQVVTAVLGSVAVHILALLIWALFQNGWIEKLLRAIPHRDAPLELILEVIQPPAERVLVPLDRLPEKQRVDSAGLREAKEAPKDAAFQSDKNLAAGSSRRPTGTAPLPTTGGRPNALRTLASQEAKFGMADATKAKADSASRPALKNASSKVTALSKKTASRMQAGAPVDPVQDVEELAGELVFRKFSSGTSTDSKVPEPESTKPAASPEKEVDDLFQEGKEQSKVKGGLAETGKNGVNASRTALGAYMKAVSRAIGARWNVLVKQRMDSLDTGSVKVRFRVAVDGSVRDVNVEHSTANRQFIDICLEVVRQARLDPPPAEAEPLLRDGLLDIPFTFSLY